MAKAKTRSIKLVMPESTKLKLDEEINRQISDGWKGALRMKKKGGKKK